MAQALAGGAPGCRGKAVAAATECCLPQGQPCLAAAGTAPSLLLSPKVPPHSPLLHAAALGKWVQPGSPHCPVQAPQGVAMGLSQSRAPFFHSPAPTKVSSSTAACVH